MFPIFLWILGDPPPLFWFRTDWQDALTPAARKEAARLAGRYAKERFNKDVDQLSASESEQVQALVKKYFFR